MKRAHLVSARDMARAVEGDAQFRPPARPRFLSELVTVPLADGLLVSGTDEAQVFRGGAATTLLPRLLPLLDGSADLESLAAALPDVAPETLRGAVALLYTRGVLEEGEGDPCPGAAGTHPQATGFYRRHVDTTRANPNAASTLRRLAGSRALVAAVGPGAEGRRTHLKRMLREGGVGVVERLDDGPVLPSPETVAGEVAVVLAEGGADLSDLDDRLAAAGVPWLHAALDPATGTAVLGPYFSRHHTLCYRCFRAGADASPPPRDARAGDAEDAALAARALADLLGAQALYALGNVAPLAVGQTCCRYRTLDWTVDEESVAARRPGCPYCARADLEAGSAAGDAAPAPEALVLAGAYEDLAGFAAYQSNPKAHQAHYRVQNIALTAEAKRYRCAPHLALPAPDPFAALAEPRSGRGGPLTADDLALLLRLTAGVRAFPEAGGGGKVRRWAPTGGNLGSVELYLGVLDVEGIPAGTYYYDPHRHALARLPEDGALGAEEFLRRGTGAEGELPGAVLALGAAYHRVARKYGPRAYRIVHLDAGVALAQLEAVAAALGVPVAAVPAFDEVLAVRWLDLDPPLEVMTGVVALGPVRAARLTTAMHMDVRLEAVPC